MNNESDPTQTQAAETAPKQPFEAPKLTIHGSLESQTQSITVGGAADASFTNLNSL